MRVGVRHARSSKDQPKHERQARRPSTTRTRQERRDRRCERAADPAYDLRERTGGARVLVADLSFTDRVGDAPAFLFDTDSQPERRERAAAGDRRPSLEGASETQIKDDELTFAMPLFDDNDVVGVVVAQRSLTEVATHGQARAQRALHRRRDRPRGGDRARPRALEHAHAPPQAPAALRAADHRRGPGGARADRPRPRRGRRPRPRARAHAGGAAPPGGARGARSSPPPRTSCARR